ncbi:S41 family peptidase [Mycoplasma nasistruthionis]|uniref:Tail specific protease domain-containing protein n=1 Tax=Mycoplasma nasistruthionis TaxID=353852 RepID=A0A4Y6I693_9MOLU|nr:S41 family peptidase [Mycoplasma nasistruthionis]QDF65155.1 hypothetical protein FIV53_02565 [Mycoplasma nasistruthionis]
MTRVKPTIYEFEIGHNGYEKRKFIIDSLENKIIATDSKLFFFSEHPEDTKHFDGVIKTIESKDNKDNKNTEYDLQKYSAELYFAREENSNDIYIPFWLFNLIFGSNNYYNFYYNGDKVYGVNFLIQGKTVQQVKTSKLNKTIPSIEDRQSVYNQLKFILENLYGLKNIKHIDDFDNFIGQENKVLLLSTDPVDNAKAYLDIIENKLDELHSVYHNLAYYFSPLQKVEFIKNSTRFKSTGHAGEKFAIAYRALYTASKDVDREFGRYDTKNLVIEGQTAFIKTSSFTSDLNNPSQDTFEIFKNSFERIQAHNREVETGQKTAKYNSSIKLKVNAPKVKNVVIDMSQNGGGSVEVLNRILGFFTNKTFKKYEYHIADDLLTTENYKVDINKDGVVDDLDSYTEFKFYVLTSEATFSAANAFAAVLKNNKLAKTIGRTSGGGMSSILPVILSDGTSFQLSSNNALVVLDENNQIQFTEQGVEPDIQIEYNQFFDYEHIDNLLKQQ